MSPGSVDFVEISYSLLLSLLLFFFNPIQVFFFNSSEGPGLRVKLKCFIMLIF